MIRLKPTPDAALECPRCRVKLTPDGWLITGMRNLAELRCAGCGGEFYGDLPAGQALYTPILLDKQTGAVYDNYGVGWFSGWLADSYANRTSESLGFKVKKFAKIERKVVLLNCLDVLYGHSLLKLLNAQYYLTRADIDLIILAPRFLEWMLPDGAAEWWIVDLPLRRGTEWNDWLAGEIEKRLAPFDEVFLSAAFSHPHQNDFDIERFTKVKPFALEDWSKFIERPRVTFIWREDRFWKSAGAQISGGFGRIKRRLGKSANPADEQLRKVISFAESLRADVPALDFAVVGLGEAKGLPEWIADLRLTEIDAAAERRWCERYASSHVVVGVHGSNMLLPSAHAGATVEIISADRQGNFLQDILFRGSDIRETFFRYRFVPPSTAPAELAALTASMLRFEDFRQLMSPEFCRHGEELDLTKWLFKPRHSGKID